MVGKILLAVFIFGFFVFIHELGHFSAAKALKIKVNDFSIGFGPAIWKRTKGDTTYAIRIFPLGGYVALDGEEEESDNEGSMSKQKLWKRFVVMVAGGFMNLLLGFIVVLIVLNMQQAMGTTKISSFQADPISSSVLQVNDKILKINGSRIFIDNDIVFALLRDGDGLVDMQIERDGQKLDVQAPFQMSKNPDGSNLVYIDFTVFPAEKTFGNLLYNGAFYTVSIARTVYASLFDLVTGKFGMNQLSGPIGVTAVISQATSMGLRPLLLMIAFITINLGVFNLLPLPALDGGRVLFLIIEAVRGKPVPAKYENYVNTVGLLLFFALIIFVSFNDIVRLIAG